MIIQMRCRFFSAETIFGLVVSFLFCSVNASAQSYIGGSFNLSGTTSTTLASFSIRVAPDLGWLIGDKWAVGVRPWARFGYATNYDGLKSKSFSLGVNPYARYRMLGHRRFGLWAEADPEFGFTQSGNDARDQVRTSSSRTTTYGVELVPVLTFQLNRHISLESRLNLFSLSLEGNHSVFSDGSDQYTISGGLSATTKDLMDTLGDITIGFLYKF